MSNHKGWRVRPDRDRFRAEVWIPDLQRYQSTSFPTKGEAKTHAIQEAGLVASGLPQPAVKGLRVTVESIRVPYLASLKARGREESHLANVRRTLQSLQDRIPDLADPMAGVRIEAWLDGFQGAPRTRNRMLVEVRAMMRWAIKHDLLLKDPTRAAEKAATSEFLRPQFSLEELRTLFFHEHDYRLRFITMFYLGLRKEEAAALTWGNMVDGVALVRKHAGKRLKGRKERIVPLQEELLCLLPAPGRLEDPVCPVIDSSGSRSFRAFLKDAGIPIAGRVPHSCRHTYASMMVATGIPDLLLKGYMGHESTQTTAVYTKQATRYVHATEHWGRGKLRVCEGMVSALKRNAVAQKHRTPSP